MPSVVNNDFYFYHCCPVLSLSPFVLPCECIDRCIDLGMVLCKIGKNTRTKCKHCRYQKCLNSAGMKMELISHTKRHEASFPSKDQTSRNSEPRVSNRLIVSSKVRITLRLTWLK